MNGFVWFNGDLIRRSKLAGCIEQWRATNPAITKRAN